MIRSKILAIASAGAVAIGGFALAAPAGADSSSVHTLECGGALGSGNPGRSLGKLTPGITFAGLQTKATSAAMSDLTAPGQKLGGVCVAKMGTGGRLAANGGKAGVPGSGAQTLLLTPSVFSSVLNGFGSCDSAAPAGTTASGNYPLNGLLTVKFSQTYTDTVTALTKSYSAQAFIHTGGFVPGLADYLQLNGTGTKGIGAGTDVSGQIYFDPIKKPVNHIDYDSDGLDNANQPIPLTKEGTASYSAQTGYMLDLGPAISCAGNLGGNIAQIQIGTGQTSLLGTSNPNAGILWDIPA